VAIQFLMPVRELRERLGDHAGDAGSPDERVRKTGRRAAPRSRARIKAVVAQPDDTHLAGQTRDVSATGLLLEVTGDPIPVGEPVHLTLDHPVTGEKMPIEGRVVRHVKSSRGVVTAMGVQLQHAEARHSEIASFMHDVQASEHSRRLGAINGPIAELGITDLLQMFAATMPRGTLVVSHEDIEGTIGFESNKLLWAEFDGLHGQPALETMLALRTGHFELEPRLVEPLAGQDEPRSLEQAVLSALCALDESRHEADMEPGDAPKQARGAAGARRAAPDRVSAKATFRIDRDALEECRADLDQTESAVIDLAQVGMSVEKMIEVIPEPEIGVMMAIDSLVARGVLELA